MSLLKLDTNIKPIYVKTVEEFNSYVEKYSSDTYELILTKSGNIYRVSSQSCCADCIELLHLWLQMI